jgi:hypothetical protein
MPGAAHAEAAQKKLDALADPAADAPVHASAPPAPLADDLQGTKSAGA